MVPHNPIASYPCCCDSREETNWMENFFFGLSWTFLSQTKPCWIFWSFPTEINWAERSEICITRDFLGCTQLSLQANSWTAWNREVWTVSPAKVVGWELNGWELSTWDTFQTGKTTLSMQYPGKEKECPSPSKMVSGAPSNRKLFRTSLPDPRLPHWGHFHGWKKEKLQTGTSKCDFWRKLPGNRTESLASYWCLEIRKRV